jgi:hypothetical protein
MKNLTPMKRLKDSLAATKNELQDNFTIVELVEKKSQYNYSTGIQSSGIEDDYLLIFNDYNLKKSFAFVFNYRAENKSFLEPSDWRIMVQTKDKLYKPKKNSWNNSESEENKERKDASNKTIVSSDLYTFDEFKILLKEFNKKIVNNHLDNQSVLKAISSQFNLDAKENSINEQKQKVFDFMEKKSQELDIEKLELKISKKSAKLKSDIEKIDNKIKGSDNYIKMKELQQEILKLEKKMSRERKSEVETLNIDEQKKSLKQDKLNLANLDKNLEKDLNTQTLNVPKTILSNIKSDLSDKRIVRRRNLGM